MRTGTNHSRRRGFPPAATFPATGLAAASPIASGAWVLQLVHTHVGPDLEEIQSTERLSSNIEFASVFLAISQQDVSFRSTGPIRMGLNWNAPSSGEDLTKSSPVQSPGGFQPVRLMGV